MTKAKKKSPYIVTPGFTFLREAYIRHLITDDAKETKHWIMPNFSITTYGVRVMLKNNDWVETTGYTTHKEAQGLYDLINKQL